MNKTIYFIALLLLAIPFANANNNAEQTDRSDLITKTQNEINKLQQVYNDFIQAYDQAEIAPYEDRLKQSLDDFYYKKLNGIITNTKEIRSAATGFLNHMMTLDTFDNAYGTASISFMLQWTKTISNYIDKIYAMDEKNALEEAVEEIRSLIIEIFVEPMKQRIAQTDIQQ